MKLATLKQGGRDGTLVVVSDDLTMALAVPEIAPTLQQALEDWTRCEPALRAIHAAVNKGELPGAVPFDQSGVHSPLPRAYQWCEASVYLVHLERCRRSTNREVPPSLYTEIGMYQGGSDCFVGPCDPMWVINDDWDVDLEAGVCVITDDVPMGTTVEDAGAHVKLVLLVNDFSLRRLQPSEMAKGLGVLQCKPANAYTPVAVSPDSLGAAWSGHMLARPVTVSVNGHVIGSPNGAVDASFNFSQLIAHLARTRNISAGSIIGAGTVANRDESVGTACLLEKRALEILATGVATTPFLKFGDKIRIESLDAHGASIFGAIEQTVRSCKRV